MRRLSVAVLGAFAVTVVAPVVMSAAAPPVSDNRGYVDSTARCAPPSKAVAFGSTSGSRVAICKDDTSGQYQYRGVRVSDGARLILAAKSTDRGYVAENDGITYTVTSSALVISSGGEEIRSESMVDFHGSAPGSGTSSAPSTSSGSTQSSAIPETTTPSTPLPPPLPAEVGHG
ncbi:hypothetical protein EAH80_14135 [Mycobacterium hodleri]|uniref:Serine/threonine protein kinase n=1 Tax=Mycolicibacterium hodleri TaxID=49897 RepID=A0A502EAJ9_9MYCO|nr:hypothetical protein EAH80_14135 [Mycolicibacterium hodleri]